MSSRASREGQSEFANDPKLQLLVDRLDELPTLPSIVYELSQVIADPMSSTSDVEKIMSNDQSLTTKVLKLANSAYYAIPGGVSSLHRAVGYIGYDTIQQLVLSASIMKALNVPGSDSFDLGQFWKHSIGVAMAAETTAQFVHYKTPSDLFTCGLVHDMGKVAIFTLTPAPFHDLMKFARDNEMSLNDAENATGLAEHTVIGRELARRWKLPVLIQASIAHHHEVDPKERTGLSSEMNIVVDIVFLSNLLMHAMRFGHSGHAKSIGLSKEMLDRLGLSQADLGELVKKIKVSIAAADNFLKIIGG